MSERQHEEELQRWFLAELKRSFPTGEDWLLDGLVVTCVAAKTAEEAFHAMGNFLGVVEEEKVAEALRLSEMLFAKKKTTTTSSTKEDIADDGRRESIVIVVVAQAEKSPTIERREDGVCRVGGPKERRGESVQEIRRRR